MDELGMSRQQWLSFLKVLFDQLETSRPDNGTEEKVSKANFLKALSLVIDVLPLQPKSDFVNNEVSFSFNDVNQRLGQLSDFFSWDQAIDLFIVKPSKIKPPTALPLFRRISIQEDDRASSNPSS
jgi:hypothetical protein